MVHFFHFYCVRLACNIVIVISNIVPYILETQTIVISPFLFWEGEGKTLCFFKNLIISIIVCILLSQHTPAWLFDVISNQGLQFTNLKSRKLVFFVDILYRKKLTLIHMLLEENCLCNLSQFFDNNKA